MKFYCFCKQMFAASFLWKVYLIVEVIHSTDLWALVCGFEAFPKSTEWQCGLAF